ncbi:hypothetical protein [Acinetobacter pittii]|uniref:hypothetical protein n=1 Tax=Acinetobacter pittii TaxID=48296 RepID=UPI0015804BA4|nr:hypothetical protein [Acinetobacter pittii]NUF45462.1 hypothetical protein [Acinetobacter pittii]
MNILLRKSRSIRFYSEDVNLITRQASTQFNQLKKIKPHLITSSELFARLSYELSNSRLKNDCSCIKIRNIDRRTAQFFTQDRESKLKPSLQMLPQVNPLIVKIKSLSVQRLFEACDDQTYSHDWIINYEVVNKKK